MSEPVCRTCRYAREMPQQGIPDVRQGQVLECHRYPPTVQILPTAQGGTITMSAHAPTQSQHWCGEYRKADHPLSMGSA